MKLLGSPEVRQGVGVPVNSMYIFLSTQGPLYHCSGWHSLKNIHGRLDLLNESKITGPNNSHHLSPVNSCCWSWNSRCTNELGT